MLYEKFTMNVLVYIFGNSSSYNYNKWLMLLSVIFSALISRNYFFVTLVTLFTKAFFRRAVLNV